jgi:uncharacterized protein YdeI (YjbR/CyaY-like superfamily)
MKRALTESDLLYLTDPQDWRSWLEHHYRSTKEIWLVYYKKYTGKQRISYNDAVEEALCFGWIDSTVRSLDQDRFAQRFCPRYPKTAYSQANKERLRALIAQGRVIPEILAILGDSLDETFEMPPDILSEIQANSQAWANFQSFSEPYIRIRIAFIAGARDRPAEFQKRLRYFIEMTAKGKQFGFGGIEKYY